MRSRGLFLTGIAVAFLATRLLGLHFHHEHHEHHEPHAASEAAHFESGLGDHHLEDHHLDEGQDVAGDTAPAGQQALLAAPLMASAWVMTLRVPPVAVARADRPPVPPPRPRRGYAITPPSQGPPLSV